ncbi:uncharacterized protein AKAW2_60968A [Aspergillus luchuensis]|uniref:Uncharacterized protein n=1 Tax=Aspergillus kawachii TaxID=1069201 RepID=A0A7R7WGU6_ASPKA|nr:uncharacterized protein AKAW2_60968A [Aspergillus luchuensis]BCS02704.1 hypothetical protein AKAW2_60968A [Aspergillus luchuensis]BCS14358.1 hypothetical protein ALUC_60914A [Aspergillus luchuensis]GAA86574.1 similar to An12g05890 [Aspergillus luchuensis IFO 4308]
MATPRKASNRPKKRTLVRWDENLNELLLLTVQSVCNTKSIKIPWADVANTMGHNVTEGAIVQHLAKLRSRRVSADKAVPPPLRRGATAIPKSAEETPIKSVADEEPKPKGSSSKNNGFGSRGKPRHQNTSSDEEWVQGRPPRSRRLRKRRKSAVKVEESSSGSEKSESDDEDKRSSVASSDELLVRGAKFLEYPNDAEGPQSKIVTLKYRRPSAAQAGNAPSKSLDLANDTTNVNPSLVLSSRQPRIPFENDPDMMDLLPHNLPNRYVSGHTSNELPTLPPEEHISSDDLWNTALAPPFPTGMVYSGSNPTFEAIVNDPLGFSQEDIDRYLTFDSGSYPHMPTSYGRSDPPLNDFDMDEDMN